MKIVSLFTPRAQAGFTLLEMSIVMIIIGLMVGGIVAGKSILDGAERRSIITDVERFNSAVQSYQSKYGSLPGDNYEATTVWGAAHATPSTCKTTNSNTVATCDGNGNGQIGDSGNEYEMWRAWQQMINAGLIEGKLTGVEGSGSSTHAIAGTNVPEGKIKGTGFTLRYLGTGSGNYYGLSDYGHILEYGANTTNTYTNGVTLLAEDALSIDDKVDDGLPASGLIRTYTNTARPNCADSDTASTAVYQGTNTTVGCNLIFITGF
jgi:prepilin-type N-terminal cleavage/methylation domain-containing protein